MAGAKVIVNARKLDEMLRSIGREDLLREVGELLGKGRFGVKERDRIICLLIESRKFTFEQIGACFGITRTRIDQIKAARGIVSSRKKSVDQVCSDIARDLATPNGRERVVAIMSRVARSKRFWRETLGSRAKHLNKRRILAALGFPEVGETMRAKIWKSLLDSGVIVEDCLVGVVLYYGLGENPQAFFAYHYHGVKETTLEDVLEVINKIARRRGVLRIGSWETLQRYMRSRGIPIKASGSKNPYWLH